MIANIVCSKHLTHVNYFNYYNYAMGKEALFFLNSQMQKTKAESGQGTCATSHSWKVTELRFNGKLQSPTVNFRVLEP